MATPVLLDSDIEKGRALIERLKGSKFPVSAAFWHLDPDDERYSLFLATPIVDEVGPLSAYGFVTVAERGTPPRERVFPDAVKVVSQDDPLTKGLRSLFSGREISETWLYSTPLPSAYFNEGYIYFVLSPLQFKKGA